MNPKGRPPRPSADRFWEKVDKNGPLHPVLRTRCWNWTAGTTGFGYGKFTLGPMERVGRKKTISAHRFSFELHNGRLAALHVLHRCDNPSCVRPDHLYEGTQVDNVRDRDERGRTAFGDHVPKHRRARGKKHGSYTKPESRRRGEMNGRAKLNDRDVRQIRRRHARGESLQALADAHGVSRGLVGFIVKRSIWKHV